VEGLSRQCPSGRTLVAAFSHLITGIEGGGSARGVEVCSAPSHNMIVILNIIENAAIRSVPVKRLRLMRSRAASLARGMSLVYVRVRPRINFRRRKLLIRRRANFDQTYRHEELNRVFAHCESFQVSRSFGF
jgi:hypothetical protein